MRVHKIKKFARSARNFYEWQIAKKDRLSSLPGFIAVEITNSCNFKCTYCVHADPGHLKRLPRKMLSVAEAETIMQKLIDGGIEPGVINWTLGGEPLLNKRFAEICHAALRYGFNHQLFASNATYVTVDRMLDFPKAAQCRYDIQTDFCASEEYFETYRGTKGSWKTILDNVRAVASHPELQHINFRIVDISTFKENDPSLLEEGRRQLEELFPDLPRVAFDSREFHNSLGFIELDHGEQSGTYRLCAYPWYTMTIAANGEVVSCCRDLDHKTVLGNLYEQSLQEIWNGEAYREMRRHLIAKNPGAVAACEECDMPWDGRKLSAGSLARRVLREVFG